MEHPCLMISLLIGLLIELRQLQLHQLTTECSLILNEIQFSLVIDCFELSFIYLLGLSGVTRSSKLNIYCQLLSRLGWALLKIPFLSHINIVLPCPAPVDRNLNYSTNNAMIHEICETKARPTNAFVFV